MLRVAYASPMPPARSGIADYSAALLPHLREHVRVEAFAATPPRFDPAAFDLPLYQIGNNGWHAFVYELALEHPGVVVMHEANLHHLLCDITIRRNRWDLYLAEAGYNGGEAALAYARRVQALEAGPDYDHLPMTRRLLERSRGLIVHSRYVEGEMRRQGFAGPIAVIPHGAWIPDVDRLAGRERLGLDESTPLVGIFGFLKPYKRIAESLRAFRRLLRLIPESKMILVGEIHAEFPLDSLVRQLGLEASVRTLGFTSEEDFATCLAACDIVLNLRYPTVGETSGTLLRSLGLGRAAIVSDVGSFSEYPDEVCLKAPVDAREEDTLFEYLHLLVARPTLARALGENARAWVARECAWPLMAARYAEFLRAVDQGRPWDNQPVAAPAPPEAVVVPAAYIASWAVSPAARAYVETHQTRLERTLEMTPPGGPGKSVLEMGAYLQITPALHTRLGYEHVRGCYYGRLGQIDHKQATDAEGRVFRCSIDHFDAERDRFPYADAAFDTVLCGELLEHLTADPMHLMSEVNRILKDGGHLLLSTPNLASTRALTAILQGFHPGFFPAYLKPSDGDASAARHNREYTPKEIGQLFWYAGFEVARLETGEFQDAPRPGRHWVEHLLERYQLPADLRGDGIYCLGRKTGAVRERFPVFLYS